MPHADFVRNPDAAVGAKGKESRPRMTRSLSSATRSGAKFTRVEMSDMKIIDHGTAAVVTCRGIYEGPRASASLKFMRVWLKKNNRWKIVAGSISK